MALLALDTATRATAVALQRAPSEPVFEARDDPPPGERPRHTTCLLALIAEVLERSGSSWEQLERIAVGVGPGTFTGLRIGIATARALAQVRALPLVGVSTLRSLALSASARSAQKDRSRARAFATVVPVLDARRGEVFAAAWAMMEDGLEHEPLFDARALAPEALRELLENDRRVGSGTALAVGEGAVAFRAILAPSGVEIPDDHAECHRVSAAAHCRLAWSLPARDPDDVHPSYIRLPDAELSRRAHAAAPAVAPTRVAAPSPEAASTP